MKNYFSSGLGVFSLTLTHNSVGRWMDAWRLIAEETHRIVCVGMLKFTKRRTYWRGFPTFGEELFIIWSKSFLSTLYHPISQMWDI